MEYLKIINDTELNILFWTLIAAIVSVIVSVILSVIERRQNVKMNSVNLFSDELKTPFNEHLIKKLPDLLQSCCPRTVRLKNGSDEVNVLFDSVALVSVSNVFTTYLGEISFVKYAIPRRYNKANKIVDKLIKYIDKKMYPVSCVFEQAECDYRNATSKKRGDKIYKKFRKKIKKSYKAIFRIYRLGL